MNLGQNYASSNDPNLYRRNVNQNLVGMHTQFMNNSINGNRILQDKNDDPATLVYISSAILIVAAATVVIRFRNSKYLKLDNSKSNEL